MAYQRSFYFIDLDTYYYFTNFVPVDLNLECMVRKISGSGGQQKAPKIDYALRTTMWWIEISFALILVDTKRLKC